MSSKKSEKASKVRISITHVGSELNFDCPSTPSEIKAAVASALSAQTPLILQDVRATKSSCLQTKLVMLRLANQLNAVSVSALCK